jgi:anti-anti-sigma regulatory factor
MKIEIKGQCLSISEIPELTAANSPTSATRSSPPSSDSPSVIEINLSQTRFMDSSGLGALFALYRATAQRKGVILRLLNPSAGDPAAAGAHADAAAL